MFGMSIPQLIIWLIIIAACFGIVLVALPAMGVVIPGWVITIFWILVVAFVAIAAIKLLMKMGGS
jgi:hypothetical protein